MQCIHTYMDAYVHRIIYVNAYTYARYISQYGLPFSLPWPLTYLNCRLYLYVNDMHSQRHHSKITLRYSYHTGSGFDAVPRSRLRCKRRKQGLDELWVPHGSIPHVWQSHRLAEVPADGTNKHQHHGVRPGALRQHPKIRPRDHIRTSALHRSALDKRYSVHLCH